MSRSLRTSETTSTGGSLSAHYGQSVICLLHEVSSVLSGLKQTQHADVRSGFEPHIHATHKTLVLFDYALLIRDRAVHSFCNRQCSHSVKATDLNAVGEMLFIPYRLGDDR